MEGKASNNPSVVENVYSFLVLLILVQQPVGHLDILLSLTLLALERLDCLLRADGDRPVYPPDLGAAS